MSQTDITLCPSVLCQFFGLVVSAEKINKFVIHPVSNLWHSTIMRRINIATHGFICHKYFLLPCVDLKIKFKKHKLSTLFIFFDI